MYVTREPEEIFKAANLAVSKKFFGNLVKTSIKGVASEAGVSEKQLHVWRKILVEEGPKIFSSLKPGGRKEDLSSLKENERFLVYETVNNLLVEEMRHEGRNLKFRPEVKERILSERDRLKEDFSLSHENFSQLMGINPGVVRRWSWRMKHEGREGLKDRSRAPKRNAKKLHPQIIKKIVSYGSSWKRAHRGRIRVTEFGAAFHEKYRKLLAKHGNKTQLADKTIRRYLKEAGLYRGKKREV